MPLQLRAQRAMLISPAMTALACALSDASWPAVVTAVAGQTLVVSLYLLVLLAQVLVPQRPKHQVAWWQGLWNWRGRRDGE